MKNVLKFVSPDRLIRLDSISSPYIVLHQFHKKTLLQDCFNNQLLLVDNSYEVVLCPVGSNNDLYDKLSFFNSWEL